MGKFQRLYENIISESPDDIFIDAPKKSVYTFIYDSSVTMLVNNIILKMSKTYSKFNLKQLKTRLIKYFKSIGIDKDQAVMYISSPENKVYINNKHINTNPKYNYLSHNAMMNFLINIALETDNASERDRVGFDYLDYSFARYVSKSGRITTSKGKKEYWPVISFWSSDISQKDITKLISLSSIIKYPNEISIELNPFKEKHYTNGKLSTYSIKSKVSKYRHNKTDDIIDTVRSKMYPNIRLMEGVDDKLKEDIYKLFKKDNFDKKIQITVDQPSLIAVKHLVDNMDIIPCKGKYKNYNYYFCIVKINNVKFVVDIGNNINGKIVPIITTLNNSEYIVDREYTKDEFIKGYKTLTRTYNK